MLKTVLNLLFTQTNIKRYHLCYESTIFKNIHLFKQKHLKNAFKTSRSLLSLILAVFWLFKKN